MSRPIPTPEQRSIISTLDTPLFVAAGAGSGKSATLAERVAWALTPGSGSDGRPYIDSLDHVLVITYTRAAADEIREKIRARLRQDEQLAPHALEVDAAWISTIHGMCIRILKAHAFELGLDPELSLIPETRASELLEHVIDECVRDLSSKSKYAELSAAFDIRKQGRAAQDQGSSIVGVIKQLCAAAASGVNGFGSLSFPGTAAALFERLEAYLGSCRAMERLLGETGFNKNATNDRAHAVLLEHIQLVQDFLSGPDRSDAAAAACIDLLEAHNGRAFGAKDLKDSWKELRAEHGRLIFSKELISTSPLRAQLLHLASEVETSFRARKAALGMVDNPDLLRITHDAFADHPEIAALYSTKFKLVMVDEFQDTNEQQVQMIAALAGTSAEHLATVGDAQQSIYRFQGADVGVFTHRGEQVDAGSQRSLTTNFRSHADILSFVERVCSGGIINGFMPLKSSPERKDAYKTRGLPRITVELTSGAHGTDSERRTIGAQQLATRIKAYLDAGGSAADVVVLMGTLRHVQVYLDALRVLGIGCVVSGGSTFTDAAEVGLVSALANLLANPYATKSGLYPVLTSELFYCDANDICLLATRDHEPVDEADTRRFDKRQLAEGFLALIEGGPGAVCAQARPSERLLLAADVIGRAFERMRSWQLADVLEGIVRESGWISRLEQGGPQGIAAAANVLAAIRFIAELADQGTFGISRAAHEFSAWLTMARQGLASLDAGSQGAVRIMTIHASKGLEFPVCAIAELWASSRASDGIIVSENIGSDIFAALIPTAASAYLADEAEPPSSASAPIEDWADYLAYLQRRSEQAERGRLLYVALTRAKEALILCISVKTTKTVNACGTHWAPQLASDACTALFGTDLPATGLSRLEYGGSEPALVRHVHVEKAEGGAVASLPPFDGGGAFESIDIIEEHASSVALYDPAVFDGIAQARLAARPWSMRAGVFSYSSVHAELLRSREHGSADGEQEPPDKIIRRPELVMEDDDAMPAPSTGDADKATNLGSAFHQLAQAMVEADAFPTQERIAAAARTWQLTRSQRARLASALERWWSSSIRQETRSFTIRRAEVPFFLRLDSAYGEYLEGAIDLLCTDPGSTHALVVDYKTGDAGLTFDEISARHALQAKFYAHVLMELGYESIACAFVCVELVDGFEEPVVARYRFDVSNIHSLF